MPATRITSTEILDGAIINEDVAANADIARTKIANNALTESDNTSVTATLNFSGGRIIIPQGAALPGSTTEGDIFLMTGENQIYVYDTVNSNWVVCGPGIPSYNLLDTLFATNSNAYVPIAYHRVNLRQLFPHNCRLTVWARASTSVTATFRLIREASPWDIPLTLTTAVTTATTAYTSTAVSATTLVDSPLPYRFECIRSTGTSADTLYVKSATLTPYDSA